MPEGNIYLLTDEERLLFGKLYEEITQGLLDEGIDTAPARFDMPNLLSAYQIQRINRSLTIGPIRALKAVQEATARKAFMIMRIDPEKLQILPVDVFAARFPKAPAEHVKKNTLFSGNSPVYVAFKEWLYIRSDSTAPAWKARALTEAMNKPNEEIAVTAITPQEEQRQAPLHYAYPITPFSEEYFLLEDHPQTQDADPEIIAKLRELLGLPDHRFIGLTQWEHLETIKRFLEETAPIWRAGAAERAAAGKERKNAAEDSGAIVNLWAAYVAPESADDKFATFYGEMLSRANIYELSSTADMGLFDNSGRLPALLPKDQKPTRIDKAQAGLFHALLSAAVQATEQGNDKSNTISIHLPSFYRDTGIDPRPYSTKRAEIATNTPQQIRAEKMFDIIRPFDRFVGKAPDGSLYRFAAFSSFNLSRETFDIHCPYFFELARQINRDRFKRLAHADLANERNQAAVEIVFCLLQGLATRGTTTQDSKTWANDSQDENEGQKGKKKPPLSYKISFKSVIARCPQIKYELEQILKENNPTKTQKYNSKLKQTFSGAFKLLIEKTDAPQYYKNFKIHAIPPTKSTLKSFITITYDGKNEDFIE